MAEQRFVLELVPSPGQIELALAQVHRRRRRSFTTAVSALTAAIVAVTFLYVRSDGAYLYRPGSPGTDSVNADVTAARRAGVLRTGGATPHRAPATEQGTPGSRPGPTTPGALAPTAGGADPRTGRPQSSARPDMTRSDRAIDNPGADIVHVTVCVADAWCSASYAEHGSRGLLLAYDVCRRATETASTLRFPTTQEADFLVLAEDGTVVWRWSRGQRFDRVAETVTVDPGTCARWVVVWDGVLDDGSRLPQGTYTLRAHSASEQALAAESTFATEPG